MLVNPFGRFENLLGFGFSVTRLPYIYSLPHVFNDLQTLGWEILKVFQTQGAPQ